MNGPVSDRLSSLPADRRALFEKLRAGQAGRQTDRQLETLRPGRGPARLVLLHPSSGTLFCYAPMIRALRPDLDVIGFAEDPGDRHLPSGQRITMVAGRVLAALAQVTDPGRCLLAGWSHGGILAFEIARLHAATGATAPHVLLIDCSYLGDQTPLDDTAIRRLFVYALARQAGGENDAIWSALNAADPRLRDVRTILDVVGVTVSFTDAELADGYERYRQCQRALQLYHPPTSYGGDVTLMVTESADLIERRWAAVVTGRLRTVRLPGDHFDVLQPPVLDTVITEIEAVADLRHRQP